MAWSGIGAEGWDGIACPDDLYLDSASSIPKALAAGSLERWKQGEIIEQLYLRKDEFLARAAQDIEAVKDWGRELLWEPKPGAALNAADSGTEMHTLLECWLTGVAVPEATTRIVQSDPVLMAMASNLWDWFCRFKPVAVAVEQVVYEPALGIAGRLDNLVTFPAFPQWGLCLVDLKNAREARTKGGVKKKPYGDSHALQLCAYRACTLTATFEPRIAITKRATRDRTYLLNPREQAVCAPSPEIQSTFILHNTPERCDLYPIETGPAVRRRLEDVIGARRWIKEECRTVVGAPVPAPIVLPTL